MIAFCFFVLFYLPLTLFIVPTVYGICSNDCPQAFRYSAKIPLSEVVCNNSPATCKTSGTSKCNSGMVSIEDNYFSIESIEISRMRNKSLVHMIFKTPSFLSTEDSRNFPPSWLLSVILNNSTCIMYTFTFESLIENEGQFISPCIEIDHSSQLSIVATYSFHSQDAYQLIRAQEIDFSYPAHYSSWSMESFELKYAIVNQQFLIFFIADPKYSSYIISIYETDLLGQCNMGIPALKTWKKDEIKSYTTLEMDLKHFNSCQSYCIQLSVPIAKGIDCKDGCLTKLLDTTYFHAPSSLFSLQRDCRKWNTAISVEADSPSQEVSVFLKGCCGFEDCFMNFGIFLYKLETDNCNHGEQYDYHMFHNDSSVQNFTIFRNVTAGTYCIRVYPEHQLCQRKGSCHVINSEIITISENSPQHANLSQASAVADNVTDTMGLLVVLSSASVLAIFVLLSIYIMITRKIVQRYLLLIPQTAPGKELLVGYDAQCSVGVSVTIFNTQEPSTKDWVFSLLDILRKGTNLSVEVLDEQLDDIIADGCNSWINAQLNFKSYRCMKNPFRKQIKKVILVESSRAVGYQEYWNQMFDTDGNELGSPDYVQDIAVADIALEDAFIGTMRQISSMQRRESDYFHVIIIHFSDVTPKTVKFEYPFPCERYYLPDDLLSLCSYLEAETLEAILPPSRVEDLRTAVLENSHFGKFSHRIFEEVV